MAWPIRRGMKGFAGTTTSQQKRGRICKEVLEVIVTLQGTNISPQNGILKMIFRFLRWDMLISRRVIVIPYVIELKQQKNISFHGGTGFLFCETCGFCLSALEVYHHLPHRIHGTGIFTYYLIYHKKSAIHAGKYTISTIHPMDPSWVRSDLCGRNVCLGCWMSRSSWGIRGLRRRSDVH